MLIINYFGNSDCIEFVHLLNHNFFSDLYSIFFCFLEHKTLNLKVIDHWIVHNFSLIHKTIMLFFS